MLLNVLNLITSAKILSIKVTCTDPGNENVDLAFRRTMGQHTAAMQWKEEQRMANLIGIDKTCCLVKVQRSSVSDVKEIEYLRATFATSTVRKLR